jgi:hypothetical protein
VDENVLPQTHDFVLYVQFSPLQFYKLKVISGGVDERVVNFLFERLVPFFEFR